MSDIKKIPYPSDMNAIEIAVWAAEFVRMRSTISMGSAQSLEAEITGTIVSANCAVTDLRRAQHAQEDSTRRARWASMSQPSQPPGTSTPVEEEEQ